MTAMQEIDYQELKAWEAVGHPYVLVDVREAFEREAFHIGGVWIPLGELISRREEVLAQAGSQPVVFYCRKGIRSAIAIQRLQGHYPEVAMYNLRGGIASISKDDFV